MLALTASTWLFKWNKASILHRARVRATHSSVDHGMGTCMKGTHYLLENRLSMAHFVFSFSPTQDSRTQCTMHSRINASAAMYIIARPGLRLPMYISISCEQNKDCMQLQYWMMMQLQCWMMMQLVTSMACRILLHTTSRVFHSKIAARKGLGCGSSGPASASTVHKRATHALMFRKVISHSSESGLAASVRTHVK